MLCEPKNAANRRYLIRFFTAMTFYVVTLLSVVWIFKHIHPTGFIAYTLALLPALAIIAAIAVWGLYLAEEKDEFRRHILIQSMLWGIGGTLVFATVWGFLELFTGLQHFQTYLAFPLFSALAGIANAILQARYR